LRRPVGRLHRRVRAGRVAGQEPGPFGIMLAGVRDVPAALPDGATAGARGGGAPGGVRADPGLRADRAGARGGVAARAVAGAAGPGAAGAGAGTVVSRTG